MLGMTSEAKPPQTPAVFNRGDGRRKKQRETQPRWPGARAIWRRVRENPRSWHNLVKLGLNESLGSQLALLFAENALTEEQAEAGRYFAETAGQYDRHFGLVKRGLASMAYDSGFGGRDDEVVRAERTRTVRDYERKARKVKKKWAKICNALGVPLNEGQSQHGHIPDFKVFDLIMNVCVHDRHCDAGDVPLLRSGLEAMVIRLGIAAPEHHKIVASHAPGARLGSRGRR